MLVILFVYILFIDVWLDVTPHSHTHVDHSEQLWKIWFLCLNVLKALQMMGSKKVL
jgi:hypothetical protein